MKNGEETDQKVTLSAENDWSASISKLDEYTDGTLNEYTWKEAEVPEGYELTLNETDGTFTTLTNTHTPEVVNATIRKTWNDAENQDGQVQADENQCADECDDSFCFFPVHMRNPPGTS